MPIDGNISQRNLKRLNKISFHYHEGWKQIEIPCGNCPACRLAKANEWATRIECESKTWKGIGCFITLTYNNENLPINENGYQTLVKKHIQDFKKRLRKYIATKNEAVYEWENPRNKKIEKPIRTFECGEYGPKKGRPHYHMLVFNWIPKDMKYYKQENEYPLFKSKKLQKIWGKGFITVGTITYKSASYVARYTMKKAGIAKVEREYYDAYEPDEETGKMVMKTKYRNKKGLIEPEFLSMSTANGLGKKYFIENMDKIAENGGILINNNGEAHLKPIPRYFRKIWEKLNWLSYESWKLKNIEKIEKNIIKKIKTYNLPNTWSMLKKLNYMRNQQLKQQENKFKLLRRDNIEDAVYELNGKVNHNCFAT